MLKTVYDRDGQPHTVEAVDAREYLRSGEYTETPRVKPGPKPKPPVQGMPTQPRPQMPTQPHPVDNPEPKPEE